MANIKGVEEALYNIDDHISTTDALEILNGGVTLPTLIKWCRDYHIGKKIGGRWYVDPKKLELLLKGAKILGDY